MTRQLDVYRDTTAEVRDVQALTASEYKWRQHAEALQRKLDEWDERYGITKATEEDPLHLLAAKVKEKDEKVKGLELKVEFHEKVRWVGCENC